MRRPIQEQIPFRSTPLISQFIRKQLKLPHRESFFLLWLYNKSTRVAHTLGPDNGSDVGGGDSGSSNSGDFRAFECFISRSVNFISNIDIIKIGMDSRLSGK